MIVRIETADADEVDPERIALLLEADNFFVQEVIVNHGQRSWAVD